MRGGTIAALVVVAVLAGAVGGFVAGNANERTVTSVLTTTQTATSETYYATPVTPTFSIGGLQTGTVCLTLPTGSPTSLNVTAARPTGFSNYTTPIEYSFAPLPLDSTFPAWLHPSMSPPYVVMRDGQTVTATLQIALDPSAQSGQTGSFAIHADFNDPVSGMSVTTVIGVEVTVGAPSSASAC